MTTIPTVPVFCRMAMNSRATEIHIKMISGLNQSERRTDMKHLRTSWIGHNEHQVRTHIQFSAMRILVAYVLFAVLITPASAQNAVTLWNSIAVQTAVRGKATAGMGGIFL